MRSDSLERTGVMKMGRNSTGEDGEAILEIG